jgi:cyclopropane fatty-acyl-phospholipid synthase-like methyltransferase
MDDDTNKSTLRAYENGVELYNAATISKVDGSVKQWIDAGLAMLKPKAHILEIGSANGRDALYMEARGFKVDRTDAVASFVRYLRNIGHDARILNILTGDIDGQYDMIFANAVLLHFTIEELKSVLAKVRAALQPGGLLTFSVKIGDGSEWSHVKLKEPRFFNYWQEKPLKDVLISYGYDIKYFKIGSSGHDSQKWFHVIAGRAS